MSILSQCATRLEKNNTPQKLIETSWLMDNRVIKVLIGGVIRQGYHPNVQETQKTL